MDVQDASWPRCACGCGEPVAAVKKTNRSKGLVKGAPKAYATGHWEALYRRPAYLVDEASGCWIWQRQVSDTGYGISQRGDKDRTKAHRRYYIEYWGPLPEDWDVHHVCGNKLCVNVQHLEAMPHREHAALSLRSRKQSDAA